MAVADFPSNATLEYLAEGAANVVYRFNLPPSSPSIEADSSLDDYGDGTSTPPPSELPAIPYDPIFQRKLLRLRKALPSTTSVLVSQQKFEKVIQPLVPSEYLVQQDLVKLPPGLQANCNQNLRQMEEDGTRPRKRHGTYLAVDATFGTLVTDMTSAGNQGQVVIDFKPKWLAQSPSAPAGSRRCRTCALRAMRKASGKHHDQQPFKPHFPHNPPDFCPLDLFSGESNRLHSAVIAILNNSGCPSSAIEWLIPRLMEFFTGNPLLGLLQSLQQSLDPNGVSQINVNESNFMTAMTLRDCTMFVVVPSPGYGSVQARLGDLDWKSPDGKKAEYWLETERRLINEGWYMGTEEKSSSRFSREERWCNV
ncbi:Inositol-pentakisphosphate 2-kinase [Hypocenomyce scalaris]|nr:Inositol-pentakisphosphate 2-kinase [Hypocenomyce scalaris]